MEWRERLGAIAYWPLLGWCLFVLLVRREWITGGEALLCHLCVLDAANGLFRSQRLRLDHIRSAWLSIWALAAVPTAVSVYAIAFSERADWFLAGLSLLWAIVLSYAGISAIVFPQQEAHPDS